MSEATSTAPAPKKKAASKPKKPSTHPKYSEMIAKAISDLKERGGSSRQALLKYIRKNFDVGNDEKTVNNHLKLALRAGVKNGTLKQSKGTGASGSFRLGEVKKAAPKKPKAKKPTAVKKAAPKKPKTKKAATPKKTKVKKEKKAAKPKKPKTPKKVKSPKKTKAAKPKKTKPAKKPASKPKAKKQAKKSK